MREPRIISQDHTDTILRTPRCPICGLDPEDVVVFTRDYLEWRNGRHVHTTFRNLSADQRERLLTGIDAECWDKALDVRDREGHR